MPQPSSIPDASGQPATPLFRRGAWGRLALALLPLVAVSGLLLASLYRPSADDAWWSVAAIRGGDWSVVRDLHRWGGELLLIAVWLHLFRVFMVGAYRRRSGWAVSVAGTLFVILSMVTGWLLRFDHGSALVVDSLALGLPFLYALHVLVLPLALVSVFAVWRRHRASGGVTGEKGES
ncbi:MAG: hypothetical protein MPN21_20815 [Thermoanaerobaculia bacterium]|nr:hypothetical protein [Thermoanaerobaculia bacterium]